MIRSITVLLSALLVGCAGPATTTLLPGGGEGYEVACSGSTWEGCNNSASMLCAGEGYQVLRKYQDYSRRSIPRTMLITCNPPPLRESPEYGLETSAEPSSKASCCSDRERLAQPGDDEELGSQSLVLSDPLEIALIQAVRSALPRNELESLVRMLSTRAPAGTSMESEKSS